MATLNSLLLEVPLEDVCFFSGEDHCITFKSCTGSVAAEDVTNEAEITGSTGTLVGQPIFNEVIVINIASSPSCIGLGLVYTIV